MGNYKYSLPEVTDSLNQGVRDKLDGKRGNAKDLIRQLEEEVAAGRATAEDVRAGQEIFLKTEGRGIVKAGAAIGSPGYFEKRHSVTKAYSAYSLM